MAIIQTKNMTKVILNTNEDLIAFLERKDVDFGNACDVAAAFLNVCVFGVTDKPDLIKEVKRYVNTFTDDNRPRILKQRGNSFKITDIYGT